MLENQKLHQQYDVMNDFARKVMAMAGQQPEDAEQPEDAQDLQ